MTTIGVRELRQAASTHLRAVAAGETITITDRGTPVARLVPITVDEARLQEVLERHPHVRPPSAPRRPLTEPATDAAPIQVALSAAVAEERAERPILE